MKRIYFTGYYNEERIKGISEIEEIVNRHGFILDFKMFSDISISMIIEIAAYKIDTLYDDLKKCLNMNDFERINSVSKKECTLLLNVSFSTGTGD